MPAPVRYFPEDWESIMRPAIQALFAGVNSAVPVVWKNQTTAPLPSKPYAAIGVLALPTPVGHAFAGNARAAVVELVQNATLYRITIAGVNYDYTSDADATASEIVAGLIAAINAGVLGPNAAAASPHFNTALVLSESVPSAAVISVGAANLSLRLVSYKIGTAELTVSVDVYDDVQPNEAESSAVAIAGALKLALEADGRLEALRAAGLAFVSTAAARRLPAVRDAAWEDRAGFDALFRATSRTAELTYWIETVLIGEGVQGTLST